MSDPLKKQARIVRKEKQRMDRQHYRDGRRVCRRCFWTWPWGHEFVNFGTEDSPDRRCVSCDLPQDGGVRSVDVRTR